MVLIPIVTVRSVYVCVCVCACLCWMSVDVVLLLHVIYSRTIAPVANVFCWLYPTLNKIYLILSYLTSLTVIYSTFYSDADQRKHQSSASLAFVWGIHRDRWIPRTKDQLRGKCFHLMTSSWVKTHSGAFTEIGNRGYGHISIVCLVHCVIMEGNLNIYFLKHRSSFQLLIYKWYTTLATQGWVPYFQYHNDMNDINEISMY